MDERKTPDYGEDIEVQMDPEQWENEGADEEDYRIADAAEYIDQFGEDYGAKDEFADEAQPGEKPGEWASGQEAWSGEEEPRPRMRRTVVGKRANEGEAAKAARPLGAYGEEELPGGRRRPRGRYAEPELEDRREGRPHREEEPIRQERMRREGEPIRQERMRREEEPIRRERLRREEEPIRRERPRREEEPIRRERPRREEEPIRRERLHEEYEPGRRDRSQMGSGAARREQPGEGYEKMRRESRPSRRQQEERYRQERADSGRRDWEDRSFREEEEEMASRKRASGRRKNKEKPLLSERVIKLVGGLIGIVIMLLVVFVVFGDGILESVGLGGTRTNSEGLVSDSGVLNILLVGQDGREDVSGSRSDSMMLVSIDKGTDKVKIISLMRDMYVSIPGHDDNRINAAYSYGGVELLEEAIEQNFKVVIDGNVQIDFESFKEIVDKIGGVEIELSQEEADYLNTAYWQNGWTLSAGLQTLTGDQALAYSRVRQVGNSDFERTERQKKVLMSAFRKVKSQGIVSMLSLASDIYPMLDTDIGIGDMISLGTTALGMEESDIESYRLPADGMYENQTIREMQVLVPDMDANRQYLYELIFGTQDGTAQEGTAGEDGAQ